MKNHTSPDFSGLSDADIRVPSTVRCPARTVCVNPITDPRWQRLVATRPSSVFHSPEWMQIITETYGWEMSAYLVLDHTEEPIAGVPFCRIHDMLGKRRVTLPFSDFCDPIVSDSETWALLSNKLVAEDCPVTLRCLHNDLPLTDAHLTFNKKARWHGLDLRPDYDAQLRRLSNSCRWRIRRAQREGLTVHRAECEDDIREFFALHRGIRKNKYRLLAQPYDFFANVWRRFLATQRGVLFLARYQGQVVGSVVFLEWQDTLYYKFSATAPAYLALGVSELMIWEGIQYGKEKGLAALDFGLSDWDQEGLVSFKRKFATEEKTISFLRYAPEGMPTSQEQEARSLLPLLTDLLTNETVPDQISDQAGAILYRFFA